MNNVTFVIPGKPHGKARPRFYAGHTYTPQETREYERLAAFLYKKAAGGAFFSRSEQVCVHALNGVAYEDDAQVGFVSAEKRYGEEPCVIVTVSLIGET